MPVNGLFKIEVDRKIKMLKISPGLYIEIIVIFECHDLGNFYDTVEICSENGLKLEYKMKALVSKEAVIFEPFINLGVVSVNTERIEYIEFMNEGSSDVDIELRSDKQIHQDLVISPDKVRLMKKVNEKEYNELYYLQNKDEKDRARLKEMTFDKMRSKQKVKIQFK